MHLLRIQRRQKFSHRIKFWEKLTGYRDRHVINCGSELDTIRYVIPSAVMAGRKLAFISDLHWSGGTRMTGIIAETAAVLRELNPDYTIFGGDMISYACHIESAIAALRKLPDIGIKLACPGNWDRAKTWISAERWREYYAAAGFKLLVNESYDSGAALFHGCDDIKTGKLPDDGKIFPSVLPSEKIVPMPMEKANQFATLMDLNAPRRQYRILLTHSPDSAIKLSNLGNLRETDLILSGHTHGGQIRLPWFGAFKTSSRYWRKFDYGRFLNRKTGTQMLVSSGLGTSLISFRWNCRPEIVFVEFINAG